MYAENVRAGLSPPLPDWVEEARLAKYYGIPPWEVAGAPARWIARTRLLHAADQQVERNRAASSQG